MITESFYDMRFSRWSKLQTPKKLSDEMKLLSGGTQLRHCGVKVRENYWYS
ncbi:hypothetical protein V6Z12_A03G094400 [Gossypium hirsutum]